MQILVFFLLSYIVLAVFIQIVITILEEGGGAWLLAIIVLVIGFAVMANA